MGWRICYGSYKVFIPDGLYYLRLLSGQFNILGHRDVESKQIFSWAAVISFTVPFKPLLTESNKLEVSSSEVLWDPAQSEHLPWDTWDLYTVQLHIYSFVNSLKRLLLTPVS